MYTLYIRHKYNSSIFNFVFFLFFVSLLVVSVCVFVSGVLLSFLSFSFVFIAAVVNVFVAVTATVTAYTILLLFHHLIFQLITLVSYEPPKNNANQMHKMWPDFCVRARARVVIIRSTIIFYDVRVCVCVIN